MRQQITLIYKTLNDRIIRDSLYLNIAKLFALRGTCERKKVGCVITCDNRIISSGYNGSVLQGMNCWDFNCDVDQPCQHSMHAEANAIAHAAKIGIPLRDTQMYTTVAPCKDCARLVIQAGIKEVIYLEPFRDELGVDLLLTGGVIVRHHNYE
jgi:dCMP deaminase